MRELRSTEVLTTEKNQVNSNISIDNIYNATRYIKPEYQAIILANYKFTELYSIFMDDNEYGKYISDLFAVSNEYFYRAIALSSLHTEASIESRGKRKTDMLGTMGLAYDNMAEGEKKAFCKDMLAKKEFFGDACKMIMDVFGGASEVGKGITANEKNRTYG